MSKQELLDRKIAEVYALEQKLRLKQGLPHLYGLKMYMWQKEFWEEWTAKMCLLCASNQSGKSSIQIRKAIHLGTCKELWPKLFPHKADDPAYRPVIWYLYPNQDTVMQEFEEKWEVEFMPRGEFKNHPVYGWKKIIRNKVLKGVRFNSGVTIYFKTYSQNVSDLQAGTVAAIFCDEELPEHIYPELNARLFATDGYFSMAFTATLGQEFWRKAIEPRDDEKRSFPHAKTFQITMYDCMYFHDGTASHITREGIQRKIDSCGSDAEVRRRIFGKFVKDSGLKYFGFSREKNYVPFPRNTGGEFRGVPRGWSVYSGVDIGSGGEKNHPSAMAFVSANQDYTKLRVFLGKRLDGIETTAGDTYNAYKEVRGKLRPTQQAYDWGCKDFGTITERAHDHFVKAEKGHDKGEEILNTAFKLGILQIYQCPEHDKLVGEIESVLQGVVKNHLKDDFIDAVRYAVASIPVNWAEIFENVRKGVPEKIDDENMERELRPKDYIDEEFENNSEELLSGCEEEFEEWNELY